MCEAPAKLAGLHDRKGRIAAGYDAELTVFEPEQLFRVDVSKLQHKLTPYAVAELRGVVTSTYVRGTRVFHQGEHAAAAGGLFV